jgi:NADH:ubiquinone oxidoreductase subunit 6 (subunit J)
LWRWFWFAVLNFYTWVLLDLGDLVHPAMSRKGLADAPNLVLLFDGKFEFFQFQWGYFLLYALFFFLLAALNWSYFADGLREVRFYTNRMHRYGVSVLTGFAQTGSAAQTAPVSIPLARLEAQTSERRGAPRLSPAIGSLSAEQASAIIAARVARLRLRKQSAVPSLTSPSSLPARRSALVTLPGSRLCCSAIGRHRRSAERTLLCPRREAGMSATPAQMALSFSLLWGAFFVGSDPRQLARFARPPPGMAPRRARHVQLCADRVIAAALPPFHRLLLALHHGRRWRGSGCITMRNVFHQALMLILSLFGVAGYFVLVGAEFLALVQVIIYIGGIMVLFLFGIMVSQNIIGSELRQNAPQAPWAAVCAGILFVFMAVSGLAMTFPPQPGAGIDVMGSNTQSLGWSLMATYTLPFICASVMLLMAMMGAIVLVRKE